MQKEEGSPPDNLADQEEGLLLVTYSPYCSQTGSAEDHLCPPLCPVPLSSRPPGQRGDSWGPFLLRNINDFPLPPKAGNRHQLAQPTQTTGCQPARPPAQQPPHHLGAGDTSGRLRLYGAGCLAHGSW